MFINTFPQIVEKYLKLWKTIKKTVIYNKYHQIL